MIKEDLINRDVVQTLAFADNKLIVFRRIIKDGLALRFSRTFDKKGSRQTETVRNCLRRRRAGLFVRSRLESHPHPARHRDRLC